MSVAPPRPKGPPLNALRAFEAAARLGSFAKAAEELSVTPGAVSQHIKTLEDWVGVALFARKSQGVSLTSEGARLVPAFTQAFDALGVAVRDLRDAAPDRNIQIAALPSIAQLWLPSRMAALRQEFPDTRLSVTAMETPPNLKRETFDITIFLSEPDGGKDERILEHDTIFPVCSPGISARLRSVNDLRNETLLVDASWNLDWDMWASEVNLDLPNIKQASYYSLYALALEEACNGAGVLIGHKSLVEPSLIEGRLVKPFPGSVSTGLALIMKAAVRASDLAHSIERRDR
ncbi:MAG: LysR family transcriptional regulator [Pseudomonadota bacterium]